MANQTLITAMLKLVSTGVKETVKETAQINSNLKAAADQAERLGKTRGPVNAARAPGGTAGSRQASQAPAPGGELQGYGNQRGVAGLTGASARDFANQAQGLGGLVRLYATYAANVFAVGAAFRALSAAMDTANMVKGLDQLGAASGVALGSLSKRLVAATDGAVSLREAMESVAKASSSGMSSDNIIRMGEVAKKASQALGVDMADAVSRITRGITKLEPELLDEIGIFTRIDPAVNAYAKSVGRAASSLTDFERRMAFANAVLAEGEQKFGEIELDTNPYTKLLATIKDVTFVGLDLINKFLGPVVQYLAQSPTSLGIAIAGLVAILVKQALPALGEFKAGLAASADVALQNSLRKAQDASDALQRLRQVDLLDAEAKLEDYLSAVQNNEEQIKSLKLKGIKENSLLGRVMGETDISQIKEKDLKALEAQATRYETLANKVADPERARVFRAEAAAHREYATSIREAQTVQAGILQELEQEVVTRERAERGYSVYALTRQAAQEAQARATKSQIVSNAAYNASLIGLTGAYKIMKDEIEKSGLALGRFGRAALYARGMVAILGGALSTMMSVVTKLMGVIGTLTAVFTMLDGWFSKSGKSSAKFSESLERVEKASDNAVSTMQRMFKDNPFSQQALLAQSNAALELADSVAELASSAEKVQKAIDGSGWDSFWDKALSLVGKDVKSKFTKTFSTEIIAAVKALEKGPIQSNLAKSLGKIFNVGDIKNFDALQQAMSKYGPSSDKVKQAMKLLKDAGIEAGIAASKSQEAIDAVKKTEDSFKELGKTFKVNDPLLNFANTSIDGLMQLDRVLSGPIEQSLAALSFAVEKATTSPIFGIEESRNIGMYNQRLQEVSKSFKEQTQNIETQKQKLEELRESGQEVIGTSGVDEYGSAINVYRSSTSEYKKAEAELKASIAQSESIKNKNRAELETVAQKVSQAIPKGISNSITILSDKLGSELAKGATKVAQDLYAAIDLVPELASKQFDLKLQELDSELALITQLKKNQEAVQLNTLAQQLAPLAKDVESAEARQKIEGRGPSAKEAQDKERLASLSGILEIAFTNPQEALKRLNAGIDTGTLSFKNFSDTIRSAAEESTKYIVMLRNLNDSKFMIANVEKPKQAQSAEYSLEQKSLSAEKEVLSIRERSLSLAISSGTISSDEAITRQSMLDDEKIALDFKTRAAAIANDEINRQIIIDALRKKGLVDDAKKAEIEATSAELAASTANVAQQTIARQENARKTEQARLKLEQDRFSAQMGIIESQQTAKNLETETGFAARESTLAMYERLGLSKEFLLNAQAELELDKLKAEETSKLASLQLKYDSDVRAANQETDAKIKADKLSAIQIAFEAEKASILQLNAIKQGDVKAELKFNLDTNAIESLKSLFDEIGASLEGLGFKGSEAFSGMLGAIGELTTSQEAYKKSMEDLSFEKEWAEAIGEKEKAAKLEEEMGKKKETQTKNELTGAQKVLGFSKKVFKEKTVAYKAIAAVEKAIHLAKLAMAVKEMIADGALTASSVANSITRTGASVVEAGVDAVKGVIKAIASMPFPLNIVAGVATAAIMGGLISQIGGKKPNAGGGGGFVPNAEQRQETQGTAMGWDSNGNKVQVRRGVFGDTDAKSESIANSLEIIKDTSVDGLKYDNKVVGLLTSIDSGINKTSKSLYGIAGLRTGSMFGTIEGSNSGKGLLGTGLFGSKTSRTITDSGLLIEGTFAELAKDTNAAVIDFFEQVTVTKKSWYGKKKTWVETKRTEIDSATSEFFKDIFSNATDLFVEIGKRSGITKDTVNQVLENLNITDAAVSLRGLKGAELQEELSAVIGAIMDDAAFEIFSSFAKYADFGEGMLETVIRVVDNNEKVQQQLKNMGLDFEKTLELTGVTVKKEVGLLSGRLIQSFDPKDIKETSYEITEALVELAGGIEEFLEQSEFFRENFLTAGQRLVPVQKAVTDEMDRLGFSSVDTKEEFVSLVESLDVTTEYGQETYQALMNVAEGFDKVTTAAEERTAEILSTFGSVSDKLASDTEKVVSVFTDLGVEIPKTREEMFTLLTTFKDTAPEAVDAVLEVADSLDTLYSASENVAGKLKGLQRRIIELTSTKETLTAYDRSEALKELDPSLVAVQEYVWALEDLKLAEENLDKARSNQIKTLEKTVNSTKTFVDNIKKLRESLLLDSSLSTLTPGEKYMTAKERVGRLWETANSTGTSEAEIAARDAARGELSSATTDFLKASRDYFASSEQYTQDFDLVQRVLSDAEVMLGEQLSIEEQSLSAITEVNTSVLSVEAAVRALEIAQANANTYLQTYLDNTVASNIVPTTGGISLLPTTEPDPVKNIISSMYGAFRDGNNIVLSNGRSVTVEESILALEDAVNQINAGIWSKLQVQEALMYQFGVDSKLIASVLGMDQQTVKDYFAETGIQQFAIGTNYVPEDMPAIVHKGERIIPAADNAQLMRSIGGGQEADAELLAEIRNLNQKIDSLERTVAEGSYQNVVATEKNTQEISRSVKDAGSIASHSEAVRRRTSIV
jgi:hypothetical protein